jgi:hypothetical protein
LLYLILGACQSAQQKFGNLYNHRFTQALWAMTSIFEFYFFAKIGVMFVRG